MSNARWTGWRTWPASATPLPLAGSGPRGARVLDGELSRLSVDCRGLLLSLERLDILSTQQRELVIDRLLALDVEDLDTEQVRWVVLMVLSSQPGQEQACARMETWCPTRTRARRIDALVLRNRRPALVRGFSFLAPSTCNWQALRTMAENLVIVESPAKAKTIKKYLGKDFEVLASYGHVRDLVPKEGAVDPERRLRDAVPGDRAQREACRSIAKALRKAKSLYLATDPDREGEAISWHLSELLKERGELKDKTVHRVAFYEITKNAIREAMTQPRELSMDLVNAQQARRALDYLVGFNLSPLLWKKVRQGLSAGRVQSPALRMICERDEAIDAFMPQEYWTLDAEGEHSDAALPAEAHRIPGQEGGAVQLHQRRPGARSRAHADQAARLRRERRCARLVESPSTASSASAIRRRRSPLPRCSRKPRASWASPRSAPCAWRSSFMKVWISAKAPSASSPICVPTRCRWPTRPCARSANRREALRQGSCRSAARLQDQVEERAGSARSRASDLRRHHAGADRRQDRRRPVQAVCADLEARHRLPDGACRVRHRRRRHARRPGRRRSATCCAPMAPRW